MIKLTRLLTNQIILGKTEVSGDELIIRDPYTIIPGPEQLQLYPFDEAIIGYKLEKITVKSSNVLYSTKAKQDLIDVYLRDKTDIDLPEKKIIL
jgi:hypothetical protein